VEKEPTSEQEEKTVGKNVVGPLTWKLSARYTRTDTYAGRSIDNSNRESS
jgi:hypothetical protein